MTTPTAAPVSMIYVDHAGVLRRLYAAVIDGGMVGVLGLASFVLVGWSFPELRTVPAVFSVYSGVAWLYFTLLEGSPLKATVGKLCAGIETVDANGRGLSLARSAIRAACKVASFWLLGAPYLLALIDNDQRAAHDRVVVSLVVERQHERSWHRWVLPVLLFVLIALGSIDDVRDLLRSAGLIP